MGILAGISRAGLTQTKTFSGLKRAWPRVRSGPVLAIGLWFVWVFYDRIKQFEFAHISGGLADIAVWQWVAAVAATGISFLAVSAYDIQANRALHRHVPPIIAMRSGFVATAIAQLVGLGMISGALTRWRTTGAANTNLLAASTLTLTVTFFFMLVICFLMSLSCLLWLDLTVFQFGAALFCLATIIGLFGLSVAQPKLFVFAQPIPIPKVRTLTNFTALGVIDLGFAALAFWLLFPAVPDLDFQSLLPVFLLATGAGILSGIPGGVGAFELVFLTLLTALDQELLLTAILAFRLVYYLLPALIAIVLLLWAELSPTPAIWYENVITKRRHDQMPHHIKSLTNDAQRAEARLIETDEFSILQLNRKSGYFLMAEAGNSLIAISDPVGPVSEWRKLVKALSNTALERNLNPVIYKCGPQLARYATNCGLRAFQIGQEALIDPQGFSLQGRQMQGLRRKLRRAASEGITTKNVDFWDLPVDAMKIVSEEWVARHKQERGFSLGAFDEAALSNHHYILAWQDDQLVGFIGLWKTKGEYALDLIRRKDDAPDGTIYALTIMAIELAKTEGYTRFSLAAVPFSGLGFCKTIPEKFGNWLYHHCPNWHGAKGLRQFKHSFRPEWEPRFLVTAGPVSAAIAGLDLSRLICNPESSGRYRP